MKIPREIFKAYDIRGLVEEVTPEIAYKVGVALVEKLQAKYMVVGRDMRSSSPVLYKSVIDGIKSQGCDVRGLGLCTTSMFNYAVSEMSDIDGGVMITASHNPSEYNGIKMADATGLPISGIAIYELLSDKMSVNNLGEFTEVDIVDEYLDKRIRQIEVGNCEKLKIVVDYGNGMGSVSLKLLLERLKIQVIELYAEPDADFPNHEANPAKASTLVDVQKSVINNKADFGIAIDGDGDRIGFIDEKGEIIRGDIMLALFAKAVLKEKPGASIVVQPNHSWATMRAVEKYGGVQVDSRIGRTFMIDEMRKSNAVVGGELSSHFFFDECAGLESIDYSLMKAIQIYIKSEIKFSELFEEFNNYVNSGEINFKVKDKDEVLASIESKYKALTNKVNKLDGLKFEFENWWFIVRPSNTEPLIRLTVESTSQDVLDVELDKLMKYLKSFE